MDLRDLGRILDGLRTLLCSGERRHKQSDEKDDDGDNDKKVGECEGARHWSSQMFVINAPQRANVFRCVARINFREINLVLLQSYRRKPRVTKYSIPFAPLRGEVVESGH